MNADISRLRLDLSIPQALLNGQPRGSVNPASLDSGETMAFVNYNLNQYHVSYRQGQTRDLDSTYANLNGGFNLGLWRYRQQSSYRYDREFGGHLDTSRRYVQRAILPLAQRNAVGRRLYRRALLLRHGLSRHSAQFGRPHAAGFAARLCAGGTRRGEKQRARDGAAGQKHAV